MRDLPTPVPVEVALKKTGVDIVVPNGESLTVGPFEPHYHEAFRLAEVLAFEDLHKLGFVPKKITEQDARSAILADDRAYRELSLKYRVNTGSDHVCLCGQEHPSSSRRFSRRMVQSSLIEALQPLHSASLDVRNPIISHAYYHLRSWFSKSAKMIIGVHVFEDISIGDRSTLTMTPTVSALYANDITIGKLGTLRFASGAVHVKCRTLSGPSLFNETSTVLEKDGRYLAGLSRETRRKKS